MTESPKRRDGIDTFNQAYQACNVLWFELQTAPTVVTVCQRIGKQNTAVVSRALRAWKEDVQFQDLLQRKQAAIRQPLPPAAEPQLGRLMADLFRQAKEKAWEELQAEKAALDQQRRAMQREWEAARAERDVAKALWHGYRSAAEREIEALRARNQALEQQHANAQAAQAGQLQDLNEKLAAATAAAGRQERQAAELSARLDALTQAHAQQVAEWRERADQAHRWHLERIQEEKAQAQQTYADRCQHLESRIQHLEPEAQSARELRLTLSLREAEIARLQPDLTAFNAAVRRLEVQQDAQTDLLAALQGVVRQAEALVTALQPSHQARPRKKREQGG